MNKTYHIYLKDNCLFKDLTEWEFNIIWRRIYKSYFTEDLTFSEITENPNESYIEASY
tara:strand:- start:743 stop:916 length:174 start_codon:yes stop_codon:yes gene_type:complete